MQWLITNLGSIVVVLVLIAIVTAIIVHMIKQKRSGKVTKPGSFLSYR